MKTRRVAVSPLALRRSAGLILPVWAACVGFAGAANAQVQPQGGQVVAGSASISQTGNYMGITAGNGAVINWQSFSIGQGNTVQFFQPNASSRVLNRVTGADPSVIAGHLIANGNVYITNQAGVYFAHGALVNVGGIYAAAGQITNADFVNNVNQFSNVTGKVENHGTINAGTANLIGRQAANYGTINAPGGVVTMTAGSDVYIGQQGGQVFARVSGGGQGDAGVTQAGQINARGGQAVFGAGDLYAMAIDHPGTTQASRIKADGGSTGVVSISGKLDASNRDPGGVGGNVEVTGYQVGLFNNGRIDASGDAGGGTVKFGGDWQGSGNTRRADAAYISKDARINADAVTSGNGGKVVVWSDRYTNYQGKISAKGGTQGGNGGAVETSGKRDLFMSGSVDASASHGRAGQWLLDPTDVTMSNAVTSGGSLAGGVFTPASVSSANVNLTEITNALSAGTSVTINTTSSGGGFGDITLIDPLSVAMGGGGALLRLNAERDIVISNTITATGAAGNELGLSFNAGRTVSIDSAITLNGGDFSIDAPTSVLVNAPIVTAGGDFTVTGAATTTLAGGITAGAGDVSFAGAVILADNITIGGNDVTFNGTVDSDATPRDLIVNTTGAGATRFNGNVGNTADLGILTTNADGTTVFGAQFVKGTVITFNDAVVANVDAVVRALTSVTFGSTIDSQAGETNNFVVNSPLSTFNGNIGAAAADTRMGVFQTNVDGTSTFNCTAINGQVLNFLDKVVLGEDLVATGSISVKFQNTIDSAASEANDLTINSPTTFILGAVGSGANGRLGKLTTDAAGTTTAHAGTIELATADFQDHLIIGADTVVQASTSASFDKIDSELGGNYDLIVNSPLTIFGGDIGRLAATTRLGTLRTNVTGTTRLAGDGISAAVIEFNDAVQVDSGVDMNATTSVTFANTLDAVAGQQRATLNIAAPLITFAGRVGDAGADTALRNLTTDTGGTTVINTDVVKVHEMTIGNTLVIGVDTTITASESATFNAVQSQASETNDLTFNGPNGLFQGTIGDGTNLGLGRLSSGQLSVVTLGNTVVAQTFDFLGTVNLNGGIMTTTLDQTYSGPVFLSADTTLEGRNITFNSTLNSSLDDRALTINTTNGGTTRFNSAVGTVTPLRSLSTNADGVTILATDQIITGGDQAYNDIVTLAANVSVSASNVAFGQSVNSDATPRSLTVETTGSGVTTFSGAVGDVNPLLRLATGSDGTTRINGGSVTTTQGQAFNNDTILGAHTVLSGSSISFGGTLNSDFSARNLTINSTSNGQTTFNGDVGNNTPLGAIITNADGTTRFFGATCRTTGDQTYGDAVTLAADITFSANDLTFNSTVDATPLLGAVALTVNTSNNGTTTFNAAVGSTNVLKSVTTNNDGETRLGANINTEGGSQNYNDKVLIFRDVTLTDTGGTGVAFGNTVDSEGSPQSLAVLIDNNSNATVSSPTISAIRFNGNVGSTLALRTLRLGANRSNVPTVATIAAGLSSNSTPIPGFGITFNTTGAFTMGAFQKMSVLGNVTINSGGPAAIGDISALGNITVNAPSILIRTRPGGQVLGAIGNALVVSPDNGTDYVAGGTITFSTTPTLLGGFAAPSFATPTSIGISPNLGAFAQRSFGQPITSAIMFRGSTVLDLRSAGPSNTNIASVIAGALPTATQSGDVFTDEGVGREEREQLNRLGITTRTLDEKEFINQLMGRRSVTDVGADPTATDYTITINRLPSSVVRRILQSYREVFWKETYNPETGESEWTPQTERVGEVLSNAWTEYAAAAGAKADPLGFRAYLEAVPAQAEALNYLNGLRDIITQLGYLGLTPAENQVAREAILKSANVKGMTLTQLEEAVTARRLGAS